MEFSIGSIKFTNKRTVVIAEAGVNHLGRMDYAEELIKTAKKAGADIIKFQTYKAKKLTVKASPRFWNWEGERDDKGSQYDSYSILDSFGKSEYQELIKLCKKYNIEFMSTPFDNESADMLVDLGMKGFKIASCDITNIPFLRYIAKFNLPMLLSTGASSIDEIRNAVNTIEEEGCKKIGIMQCTLCYPTPDEDANLRAIHHIKEEFPNYAIGFSDHTLGTIVPAASILYGVTFIEKHYTFDKTLPDSADHWLSLDEKELTQLVSDLRILEKALGSPIKEKKECETKTHQFARRSVVANKDIEAGQIITNDDITCKRPGTGLAPVYLDRFIGLTVKYDIKEDTLLKMDDAE
jgi:N,N'-diacetyllegionaminate synthase